MQESGFEHEISEVTRARIATDLDRLRESHRIYDDQDPVDAALAASGALMALVNRSLGDALELVTLPQLGVMMALSDGPKTPAELAAHPEVTARPLDRVIEGMVTAGWISWAGTGASRAACELTAHGTQLIAHVNANRRADLAGVLDGMPRRDRHSLAHAFAVFADAASRVNPKAASNGLGT